MDLPIPCQKNALLGHLEHSHPQSLSHELDVSDTAISLSRVGCHWHLHACEKCTDSYCVTCFGSTGLFCRRHIVRWETAVTHLRSVHRVYNGSLCDLLNYPFVFMCYHFIWAYQRKLHLCITGCARGKQNELGIWMTTQIQTHWGPVITPPWIARFCV